MSWSRVQNLVSANTSTSNVTSLPITTSASVAAGDKIIVRIMTGGTSQAFSSCSDNGAGLTWRLEVEAQGSTQAVYTAILSADAPSGLTSGTVITPIFTVSSSRWVYDLAEYSGLATGAADKTAGQTHAAAMSLTSGSTATLSQASGELAVGCVSQNGATTLTGPGGSWSDVLTSTTAGSSSQKTGMCSDLSTPSTTGVAYATTSGTSAVYSSCVAVFETASAAAPTLHQLATLGVGV